MLDYISCLNRTARFTFPYLNIQDSISLNSILAETLSKQLRSNDEAFSDNQKMMMLFKVMSYLRLSLLEDFMKIEFEKTSIIVNKICEKEDEVLSHFRRYY